MLRELNIVRNKANAVNLKRLIEESNIDDFVVAFPFEKFMIDMDLSTRNKSDVQNTAAQLKRFGYLKKIILLIHELMKF